MNRIIIEEPEPKRFLGINDTCATCYYWLRLGNGDQGRCKDNTC